MTVQIIAEAWQDYVIKVLPAGVLAESVQYKETKKAFYAGAGCLLSSIMKTLGPGEEATESDLLIMNGIQAELAQFLKDVQRGG